MAKSGASEALVFISGASSGIGLALARSVPFPARVIGISRRAPPDLEHVSADLADPSGWKIVRELFEREIPPHRGARVFFAHAAGTLDPIGFAGEVEGEAYRRQVLLNVASPLVLGDTFLHACQLGDAAGDLVLLSSGAAQRVYEGWSAYNAGKAAVDHWVRTVGAEQARRQGRCRVLSVAPGVVATPMQEAIRQTALRDFPSRDRFVALHQRNELRDPAEAARDVWRLVEAAFENGAVVDLRKLPAAGSASD